MGYQLNVANLTQHLVSVQIQPLEMHSINYMRSTATLLFGETSEITGGEHLVEGRCANKAVAEQFMFMFMFNRYQDMIERFKTDDLSESQPTKGNIEGGLTTIEEKALGNIQKIGKKCQVDGVLDKA